MATDATTLLEADLLERVRQLELFSRFRVEGQLAGLSASPFKGFAADFIQHRQYFRGDSPKFIDWRVYARTGRYYVRVFEELCHARVSVLLDTSASMAFRGDGAALSKHDLAIRCAAILFSLAMLHGDSFALTSFDSAVRTRTSFASSHAHLQRLLRLLVAATPQGAGDIPAALQEATGRLRHKGLTVVLSDCMDDPERIVQTIAQLRFRGSDVIVMQIFDPAERALDFDSVTRFHDLESEAVFVIDPLTLRREYQREFDAHQAALRDACRQHGFDHVLLPVGDHAYEVPLLEYLRRRMEGYT